MRAVVYDAYGPPQVLKVREMEKPAPRSNEVLIRVCATTVNVGDCRFRKADPVFIRLINGIFRPKRIKILGMELAGIIEAIGAEVDGFEIGDKVFGPSGRRLGGYAEYKCLPTNRLCKMPQNASFSEAAAISIGGNTALYFLKEKGNLKAGQEILIYGASGSVGTFAVQLAYYFGAIITAVCSTANHELVRSLGAATVIDYNKTNFSKVDKQYDLIFDAVGKITYSVCKKILKPKGVFKTVNKGLARVRIENQKLLKELVESGQLKIVIDREYDLDQMVEAHHYVDLGHKKGNVTINIAN